MRKAAIVTLIGYLLFIVMSEVEIYSALDMFRSIEKYGGYFPVREGMYLLSCFLGIVPEICYAIFFVLVLQNKLKPVYGILGASATVFNIIFYRIILYESTDYGEILLWVYPLGNLISAFFLLQYFCNLKLHKISPKLSIAMACSAFVINWSLCILTIYQNFSRNIEHSDILSLFTMNISNFIYLIAFALTSVFFFAMANNISKNGK